MFQWLCECTVQWWYKSGTYIKTSSETLLIFHLTHFLALSARISSQIWALCFRP